VDFTLIPTVLADERGVGIFIHQNSILSGNKIKYRLSLHCCQNVKVIGNLPNLSVYLPDFMLQRLGNKAFPAC